MNDKKVDVRALAALARIEVPDAELEKLEREIPDILKFVETIQAASVRQSADSGGPKKASGLHNVMREDGELHESGIYTEQLLAQVPARQGNRLAVKQVISRNKK